VLRSAFIVAVMACHVVTGCTSAPSSATNPESIDTADQRQSTKPEVRPAVSRMVRNNAVSSYVAAFPKGAPLKAPGDTTGAPILSIVDSDLGFGSAIAPDLARIVGGDKLDIRLVPSRGISDDLIALMRSEIDLAIIQSDAWQSLTTDILRAEAREQVQYIAGLYNKDLHILASRDVVDIRGLQGRKVNIGTAGSGANWSARRLFAQLAIEPDYEEHPDSVALARMRAGEIVAVVLLERAPVDLLSGLPADAGFKLLPVGYDEDSIPDYAPGRLEATAYPNLIRSGAHVETIAVRTVLAVRKAPEPSDRYQRLAQFTARFFTLIPQLVRQGDPKWAAVQPSVVVEGLERFAPAQKILDRGTLLPEEKAQANPLSGGLTRDRLDRPTGVSGRGLGPTERTP
jgi:TRAP-type uncharacterized transport system substrate-binding protein